MSQICHINLFSGDNWQKVDIWPLFQTQWKETGHHKQGIKENFRKQLREVISTDEWCFYANYPFLPCPPPASTDTRVFLLDAKNFICAYEGIEYWWFKWWLWWRWSSQMLQEKHIFWDGLPKAAIQALDPMIFGQVGSFSFVCSPEQPILPLLRASWQQKQLRSLPWQFGSGQAALSGQEIL